MGGISDAESRRPPTPDTLATREAPLVFRRVVIIGGGCYGSWYAQQLDRAMQRGALMADEVVVVDRDPDCRVAQHLAAGAYVRAPLSVEVCEWGGYLERWLGRGASALERDAMVPSPLMPHLCLEWLMTQARARWPERSISVEPLTVAPDIPWQRAAADGRHYVSFATWTCPVNCIEPARCPATRDSRDWSMPVALAAYAARREAPAPNLDASLIFPCTHRAYGVGMIDAGPIAAGAETLRSGANGAPWRCLVGTVSHCHGALGVLTIS